jgi:hypothetical protein
VQFFKHKFSPNKRLCLKASSIGSLLGFLCTWFLAFDRGDIYPSAKASSIGALSGAAHGLLVGYLILLKNINDLKNSSEQQKLEHSKERLKEAIKRFKADLQQKNTTTIQHWSLSTSTSHDYLINLSDIVANASIPEECYCPITQEIMREPVIADDGHSYEREALQIWYDQGNSYCPLNTNKTLTNPAKLPTNCNLQSQIIRLQNIPPQPQQ